MLSASSTLSLTVISPLSSAGLKLSATPRFASSTLFPHQRQTHIRGLQCQVDSSRGFLTPGSAFLPQKDALRCNTKHSGRFAKNKVSRKVSASAAGAEAYPNKQGSDGPAWLKKLTGSSAPPAIDILWAALSAFASMAALAYLDKLLVQRGFIPLTIGPMAAVAVILAALPDAPVASKWNIFVSHIGAAAVGVAALALCGPGWVARSAAVAASVAFMQFTGSMHPPAGGLALLFVDSALHQSLGWRYVLFPGLAASVVVVLVSEAMAGLRKSIGF